MERLGEVGQGNAGEEGGAYREGSRGRKEAAAVMVLIRHERHRHQLMKSEKAAGGCMPSRLTPVIAV